MAERYTRLFSLDENLYCEGSPVIIRAGALLKDNQMGNVLAQIKYQNISRNPRNIKALRVAVTPLDVRGQILGEPIEFDYLDLSVPRDGEFGQKTPILLPDRNTRGFSVAVSYAVFEDNTEMMPRSGAYQSLPRQRTLADALQDNDTAMEYAHRFGGQCLMEVTEFADLWLCSCGAVNRSSETNCHSCKNNFKQLTTVDYGQLKSDYLDRIAKETAEREERERVAERRRKEEERVAEERRRKEEEAARRRQIEAERQKKLFRKKVWKISAIVAGIGIFLVASVLLYTQIVVPELIYKKAIALHNDQKYEEAIKLFSDISEYKDSQNYLNSQVYLDFLQINSFGNYSISYDEKGRVLLIGSNYRFSYDDKDKINKITIPKNGNVMGNLQEEKNSFSVNYVNESSGWEASYTFDEYGILQDGESQETDWNVTIRESYAYHIDIDENTHFPTRGEKTYQVERDGKHKTYSTSYTFGMDENDDGLLFWENENGKRTDYPIEYTISEVTISPEIAAQNERLIMAFCLMIPNPQSPL